MEEEYETITLTSEDGEEIEFELLDVIEYENHEYAVLIEEGETDVVIVRVDYVDDENITFQTADDDIVDKVFEIFKEEDRDDIEFE